MRIARSPSIPTSFSQKLRHMLRQVDSDLIPNQPSLATMEKELIQAGKLKEYLVLPKLGGTIQILHNLKLLTVK